MVERLLKFWSLLFIVCRMLDIGCDFYYIYCSKDLNSVQDAILAMICMCGSMFNWVFLGRLFNALGKVLQPSDIGKINVLKVLLPQLNFFVLEGVVNVLQAGIVSYNMLQEAAGISWIMGSHGVAVVVLLCSAFAF
ncbi:Hypothetical predicted protein [Paramuricea clavata]|uniref:Uncharacterized protein n=1 Tax=Paramuricea clavata TaxID=317549 RepID=A0A6S7JD17_PARCT|nr:Hypothetical predicted protein [Paramuricea clavata]